MAVGGGDKTARVDVFTVKKKPAKSRIIDPTVRSRVLRRGMWNVADIPMIVTKCSLK